MDLSLTCRRELRRRSTDAEALLWSHLRGRRFAGFKFRRQYSCGPFILDFFCAERRLAIELDGGQHFQAETQAYDISRTRYLSRRGVMVLRFPTDLVFRELEDVLDEIVRTLSENAPARHGQG